MCPHFPRKPDLIRSISGPRQREKGNHIGAFRPKPKQVILPPLQKKNFTGLFNKEKFLNLTARETVNNTQTRRKPIPMRPDHYKTKFMNDTLAEGLSSRVGSEYSATPNFGSGTNPGSPFIPVRVVTKKGKGPHLTNVDGNRVIHTTVYETGYKPTKANLMLARQFGVENKTIDDSKISYQSGPQRDTLTGGSGFNTSQIFVPGPAAQCTSRQLRDSCWGSLGSNQNNNEAKSERMVVLNIKQQYMIKNQSANFGMEFTIHLVKLNQRNFSRNTLGTQLLESFYNGTDLISSDPPIVGRVPKFYQRAPINQELPATREETTTVEISNKLVSLPRYIPNFKNSFTIVESFTKTILPGEYWNFSHIHNCGAGIDAQELSNYTNGGVANLTPGLTQVSDDHPYTLGVIFQVKGKICEAFHIPAANLVSTHIGTSPTFFMYEFKHQANIVRNQESAFQGSLPYIVKSENNESTAVTGVPSQVPGPREIGFGRAAFRSQFLNAGAGNVGLYYIPFNTQTVPSGTGIPGIGVDIG